MSPIRSAPIIRSHICLALAALIASPLDTGTAHFDASNLEIVSVDVGNRATNVIPAKAQAKFNVRFNDLWTPQTLAAELGKSAAAAAGPAAMSCASNPATRWLS